MFMQRIISSLILVPLVLCALFYAPPIVLGVLLVTVLVLAGMECWKLIPLNNWPLKIVFLFILLACLWPCLKWYKYWQVLGLVVWGFNCLAIMTFPTSQRYWGYPIVVTALCLVLLPLFAVSLMKLYFAEQGKTLIVYLLCLVWAADVGAYLAGKQWGKNKLIPQVSPGKSWEGLAGGFTLSFIVTVLAYLYFSPAYLFSWFILAAVTVIISIFGDLFVSILKRRSHLKDTGALIPGHGGVLDRLDSLIAALPIFYFGLPYNILGIKSLVVSTFG